MARSYGRGRAASPAKTASGRVITIVIKTIAMKEPARFDPYLVDSLMPDLVGHDRQPSAFIVYLYLSHRAARARVRARSPSACRGWRPTPACRRAPCRRGLRTLVRRRLLRVDKASRTAVPSTPCCAPARASAGAARRCATAAIICAMAERRYRAGESIEDFCRACKMRSDAHGDRRRRRRPADPRRRAATATASTTIAADPRVATRAASPASARSADGRGAAKPDRARRESKIPFPSSATAKGSPRP